VFVLVGVTAVGTAGCFDHGLVMTFIWSVLVFGVSLALSRNVRHSAVIGLLVACHWVCDFIAYYHTLPLALVGSPLVGLGLYANPVVMVATDLTLFAAGIFVYLRATKPVDRTGTWGLWLLVAYIVAVAAACALPGRLIVIAAALIALTLPLRIWVDRHRRVVRAVGRRMPAVSRQDG
jgi:hypothetical protein